MLAQRLEDGEAAQILAALGLKGAEGFGAGIALPRQMALAEMAVEKGHGPALQRRDRRIIHQLDLARLRQGLGEICARPAGPAPARIRRNPRRPGHPHRAGSGTGGCWANRGWPGPARPGTRRAADSRQRRQHLISLPGSEARPDR